MTRFNLQPRPQRARRTGASGAGGSPTASLLRGVVSGVLAFVVVAMLIAGGGLIGYAAIASGLPAPSELTNRASAFQTTRILDREGNLLAETFDPNAGRRTVTPLERISPYLLEATIATEDANFYRHAGVDPVALIRAIYYAVRERDLVSGGSTIPQQLVKLVFLSPERTMTRKIKEAILSAEITRRFEKDEILEIYLNELYYGNFAYGVNAAAQTYFGKNAADLTLGEASLLAGLPQLPAYYDPYTHPDRARQRQAVVLSLMVESGFITSDEADAAWLEPLTYTPLSFDMQAPHFTLYVRQQLEALLGPEALYQTGLNVTTTLDPQMQEAAERIVAEQVAALAGNNVSNGALVALRPDTGEIVSFVGSADFDNVEIDGQVNMALAPRQPGSSIKPLVYLAAFEQPEKPVEERWTPGTLLADIEEPFPDGANPPYVPTNYDNRERGMVTVRTALARSLNIPAVRTLQAVELPDFLELARRMGITTLNRPDFGLSLSLGAGEIPLIELTAAYSILANHGVRIPPVAIRKITDSEGNVLCDIDGDQPCQPLDAQAGQQVVSAVDAFLITDILSDNEARAPAFGPNSLLRLNRPAAVKTGTTNDIRDNLTVGYTPQLVTGVWVGNANNTPMHDVSGISGAGPIWNQFMTAALADEPAMDFTPPPGVRQFEVCADTGTLPSEACPETRRYWFAEDRPPLPPERDLYQVVRLDRGNGQLATEFTPPEAIEEKIFKIYPEPYRQWAIEHGIPQPPAAPGDVYEFGPELFIRAPVEGEVVNGIVPIFGTANAPGFAAYELQYGISHDPGAFSGAFSGPHPVPVTDGRLGDWDTTGLGNGPHTLRLVVRDASGATFEQRVRVFVEQPTPTPVPTETWTPAPPTATFTPIPTETVIPTEIPTETPTETPVPTELPTEIPTETVTPEPPTEEPPTAEPPTAEPPTEEPPTEVPTETPTETPLPVEAPTEIPAETATPGTITDTLPITDTIIAEGTPVVENDEDDEPAPETTPEG